MPQATLGQVPRYALITVIAKKNAKNFSFTVVHIESLIIKEAPAILKN
jgi:hypothetical protein